MCDIKTFSEILAPFGASCAGAIGDEFLLKDDDARSQRAKLVDKYRDDLGLERLKLSAQYPNLNPIELLYHYLGKQVTGCLKLFSEVDK